jgi:hypothetical protein
MTGQMTKHVVLGNAHAFVDHCVSSGGSVEWLRGQDSAGIFFPGHAIPPYPREQMKGLVWPLPPRYRADLRDVLMHGSFLLLTNQDTLVSQGVRYSLYCIPVMRQAAAMLFMRPDCMVSSDFP